ncbi:MAG TPA: hypothetical protein VG456_06540 [Candidatus Sulfopaludibacter sp.]|jgi:hypothetical protein|nr:hypothetical protein [Candidatus Sulfopaludibacter sp.]
MLTIRAEQMKAFQQARRQEFYRKLELHLAAIPDIQALGWNEERIRSEVEKAVAQAAEFQLKRESEVARLAEIFCTRLDGFSGKPVDPEGLNILYAYGVAPKEKFRRFEEYLGGQDVSGQ